MKTEMSVLGCVKESVSETVLLQTPAQENVKESVSDSVKKTNFPEEIARISATVTVWVLVLLPSPAIWASVMETVMENVESMNTSGKSAPISVRDNAWGLVLRHSLAKVFAMVTATAFVTKKRTTKESVITGTAKASAANSAFRLSPALENARDAVTEPAEQKKSKAPNAKMSCVTVNAKDSVQMAHLVLVCVMVYAREPAETKHQTFKVVL